MKIILAGKMLKMLSLILMVTATIAINGQQWRDQEKEMIQKYDQLVKDGKMTKQEADINIERESNAIRRQAVMDIAKNNETDMHFYGKVVDQNGDPVERATVTYSYEFYGYKKKVTWTDKEGLFEITERGMGLLMIEMIEQEGYDKSFDVNKDAKDNSTPRDYDFTKQGTYHQRHDTDEKFKQPIASVPEIFKIRKKGEPTMLFSTTDKISFVKNEEKAYALCFATYGYWYTKDLYEKVRSSGKRIDVVATGRYQDTAYILNFKAVGDSSAGIILSDERLSSAPADGYNPEAEALFKEGTTSVQKELFLYVKSGNPPIFSRVEMKAVVYSQGNQLSIEYHSYTNPYGERNLEGGWHMYALKEYNDQVGEAKKMLKEGKYPPKPDFKALEEEGKKEYLKTHKNTQ